MFYPVCTSLCSPPSSAKLDLSSSKEQWGCARVDGECLLILWVNCCWRGLEVTKAKQKDEREGRKGKYWGFTEGQAAVQHAEGGAPSRVCCSASVQSPLVQLPFAFPEDCLGTGPSP